jgi:hypothetical protein
MSWNPNADTDCAFGLEWAPLREVDRPVGGVGEASYSWTWQASTTLTVENMWNFSSVAVPNAYDVIDIYDVANISPVNRTVDRYQYSADADTSLFIRPVGAAWYPTPSRVESVDQQRMDDYSPSALSWYELLGDPSVSGIYQGYVNTVGPVFVNPVPVINRQFLGLVPWFKTIPDPSPDRSYDSLYSQWAFHVDDLESNVGTDRIIGLTVACLCQRYIDPGAIGGEWDVPYRIRPAISMNGQIVLGQAQIMPITPQVVSYTWYQNPITGRSWTTSELEDFNSTIQDNAVMWLMSRPGGANGVEIRKVTGGAIYEAWADVEHVTETRVAEAIRVSPQQVFGWNEWSVETIAGGSWTATGNEKYLFNQRIYQQQTVDRRPALSTQGLSVRALGGGQGTQNGIYETVPEFLHDIPRNVGTEINYAPTVLFDDGVSGYFLTDSQPYAYITDGDGELGVVRDPDRPQLWQTVSFTADSDVDYRIRFWAKSSNESQPDSFMVVYVVDSSYTLEATSTIIRPNDLEYPGTWQKFDLPLTQDGWNESETQHTIMFVVYGGGSNGWQVLTLNTGVTRQDVVSPTSTEMEYTTFGGIIDCASGGDPTETLPQDPWIVREDADVSVVIGATPETPSGFTATYVDFDTGIYGPSVLLSWDGQVSPDACSGLGYYEIQRKTTVVDSTWDSDWQTIYYAYVDGTAETYSIMDYEANRGALGDSLNTYRIRLVSDIDFNSAWSNEVEVSIPVDGRCGYFLSTNQLPIFNVWFDDVGVRSYNFLETVSYYEFEGTDGSVEARGLTDRLDEFSVDFLLAAAGAAGGTVESSTLDNLGRRVFDRLLFLTGNKRIVADLIDDLLRLAYVCVTDNNGNRWFASIQTPTGVDTEPGSQYRIQTTIKELTRTPYPVPVFDSGDGTLISLELLSLLAPAVSPPEPPAPFVPSS